MEHFWEAQFIINGVQKTLLEMGLRGKVGIYTGDYQEGQKSLA